MKRLFCCIACIALLLSANAVAFADVGGEHIDDFYWRNARKFDYSVGGYYYVNSPDGYVTAWTSPSALKFVDNLPNGTLLSVQARYGGWATAVYLADGKFVEGNQWIPLEYLTHMYNTEDFAAEFAAHIDHSPQLGSYFDGYKIKDHLCFYSYPGSGTLRATVYEFFEDTPLEPEALYVDNRGQRWCYCSYYSYTDINGWICLDAPENPSLPVTLDREPTFLCQGADVSGDELERLRYDYIISGGVYALAATAGAALIAAAVLIYKARAKRVSQDCDALCDT